MAHLQEQARRGQRTERAVTEFAKLAQRFLGPGPERASLLQAAGQARIADILGQRELSPESADIFRTAFPDLFKPERPITRRGAEFGLAVGGILGRRRAAERQARATDQQLLNSMQASRRDLLLAKSRLEQLGESLTFAGSKEQQRAQIAAELAELEPSIRDLRRKLTGRAGVPPGPLGEPPLPPEEPLGLTRTVTGGKPTVRIKFKQRR